MVTNVARTWARPGERRPLAERWSEAENKLVALGGSATFGPRSELVLDQMNEAISLRSPPPSAPIEPLMGAALDEDWALRGRFNRARADLKARQAQLQRTQAAEIHEILADVPQDAFADVPPPRSMSIHDRPRWASITEARSAVRALADDVSALEGRLSQLAAACSVETYEPAEINRMLILALHRRIGELEKELVRAITINRRGKAK